MKLRNIHPIYEIFDRTSKIIWGVNGPKHGRAFFTVNGQTYVFNAYKADVEGYGSAWSVGFAIQQGKEWSDQATGLHNSLDVFGAVTQCIEEFFKTHELGDTLIIDAENKRLSLYTRFIKKMLPGWNVQATPKNDTHQRIVATRRAGQ